MSQRPPQSRDRDAKPHKKPASSAEPVRQNDKAARPTLKVKKNARSRWLLEVAKEAHKKGGTWASLGTMTYRVERPVHPHTGKALVQLGERVELAHVLPDVQNDLDGLPTQIYWCRVRGTGKRVLVYPPYLLAIVTAEHSAGGVASKQSEGTRAGAFDPADVMREPGA